MAMDRTARKKRLKEIIETPETQSDLQALLNHLKERPWAYAGATAFVALCFLAGMVYRLQAQERDRQLMTKYARALKTADPAVRVAELEALTEQKSAVTAEALYMMGEAAFQAKEYDKAKAAFERLRKEYPDSAFAPQAVEGMGYVAEERGELELAVSCYQEVLAKWPDSITARWQALNLGRCLERLERLQEAVAAYGQQVATFPGSNAAKDAAAALERIESAHPELFPTPGAQTAETPAAPGTEAAPLASDTSLPPERAAEPTLPEPTEAEEVPAKQAEDESISGESVPNQQSVPVPSATSKTEATSDTAP